jgi:prepilin-type N-terminal cleavage/methylation domain-containing protein
MTTRREPTGPARAAFTLVELLVVMFLLALLAGLTFLLVPNINDQSRAPRGAVMLQQWLQIAKNNAMRDRTNWGVRLTVITITDPTNPNATLTVATDAQYIQQPGDFVVVPGVADPFNIGGTLPFRRVLTLATDPTLKTVVLEGAAGADFSGGFTDRTLWPVQTGDYLEVNGGLPRYIASVTNATTLTLASPLPAAIPAGNPTMNYRIIRSPRVQGEDQLQMPGDVIIDLGTNTTYNNPLPWNTVTDPVTNTTTSTLDILFSPSGAVIGRGTSGDSIYLWVRDSLLPLFQGDNTLVAVQVRTGSVFAFPVDNTPGGDPYSIAKTGRAPQS